MISEVPSIFNIRTVQNYCRGKGELFRKLTCLPSNYVKNLVHLMQIRTCLSAHLWS